MYIRANLIRAAYLLQSPTLTPILLKLAEEGVEEEADKAKGGGPPPGWSDFLKEKYEGGKKKVTNPNPDSKKKHPNVSISTALKTKSVWNEVYKEYKEWMKDKKEEDSSGGTPAPEEEKKTEPETKKEEPAPRKIKVKAISVKDEPVYEPEKTPPEYIDHYDSHAVAKFAEDFSDRDEWDIVDKDAMYTYTGGSYEGINGKLRNTPGYDSKVYESNIRLMDRVFKRPASKTKKAMSVSRGIGSQHPLALAIENGTLELGTTFEDPGYTSTSIKQNPPWGHAKLRITVPKGSRAVYLGPPDESFSEYTGEHEVLLNRDTTFTVTGWDKKKGEIYLEAKTG